MSSAVSLHETFDKLLEATTRYFAEPQANLDQDKLSIEGLRELALLLAAESRKPHTFGRFVAYILGTPSIQAQYPLHTIQFMCLTALALKDDGMKERDMEEVLTAAYLADFGFRAAWLSFQNAHSGASVFHLRGLGLSWWSLWIERMILYHHDAKADASPHRIFSVIAQFLALTQRTGVDDAGQDVLTPARAIETIMDSAELDADGKKYFLNAASVYPLGSWVRLNDGTRGLVLGHTSGNPLRPALGVYHQGESFGLRRSESAIEVIDLNQTPTRFIVSESQPTSEMAEIFAHPELWIRSWQKPCEEDEVTAQPRTPGPAAAPAAELPGAGSQGWATDVRLAHEAMTPTRLNETAPAIANFVQTLAPSAPAPMPTIGIRSGTLTEAPVPETRALPESPAPIPVATLPALPTLPLLTPEEVVGAASELAADIARTLERLEVELHHLRHRGQSLFTDLPRDLKKTRRALEEIRAFTHSLAGAGDEDTGILTGALHIWEGDIAETESQLHELRSFSSLFLESWESKKRDAQRLLQSLHGAELAGRWTELSTAWRDRLKPALEDTAKILGTQWLEKQQTLQTSQNDLQRKLETAQRTRLLLIEKMALTQLTKGLRLRKEKAWEEAIAAFQKALALNPSLWEAHTYLGLCHMEAADEARLKRLRMPPAA